MTTAKRSGKLDPREVRQQLAAKPQPAQTVTGDVVEGITPNPAFFEKAEEDTPSDD